MKNIRSALGATLFVFSSLIQFSSQFSDDACGKVAKEFSEVTADYPYINAKTAYECLIDVPFHQDQALDTIQQMRLFLQFYSAQAYFAHPPTDELELYPVDMNKTLDYIESTIHDGGYSDEYMFNKDLFDLFGYFRDGHVMYLPLCYAAFTYQHSYSIVSVAKTPDSIPEIYGVAIDDDGWTIGDKIARINDEDPIDYLAEMANTHPELLWIDPDARWNQLMMHYSEGKYQPGLFAYRRSYDDEDLIITWESGSTTTVQWRASSNLDSIDFESTDTFYSNVCIRSNEEIIAAREHIYDILNNKTTEDKGGSKHKEKRADPSLGSPIVKRDHNSSYYSTPVPVMAMTDDSLQLFTFGDDIGVLMMNTFMPEESVSGDFSGFIADSITYLQELGIKKIIIDVSGNGGGMLALGNDAAMQFFPTADHFFGTNMRWNPALEVMLTEGENLDQTFWDIGHYHEINGSDFSSYQEFLGPVYKDGDYFTKIARPDFIETNEESTNNLPSSYPGPQPFDTENIILLSSGMCGSTCAVFAEAMAEQGVRSVVFGGRPREGPMQCVGGIKGSQVLSFDQIAGWAYALLGDNTYKYDFIPEVPTVATIASRINLRNSWRKDDQETPIEFIYSPAEYRLSYTAEMYLYPQVMWAAARNVAWQGAKHIGNDTTYSSGTGTGTEAEVDDSTDDAVGKKKNKGDGISGEGVDDDSDDNSDDNQHTVVMSWDTIGQLIWLKLGGRIHDGIDLGLDI